jgi:hydroxymethylpyrimidine/phosphomethylpyrimidine kinase
MSYPTYTSRDNPISTPIVLTIAGSDSSGGAGIQADIKAISATGGYACSVITAITAQNTQSVNAIFPIPIEYVAKQLDAVFMDLNIVAVKIGMLADIDIIKMIAKKIKMYRPQFVVVDPVMVATSGDLLLPRSATNILKSELFPLADLITPNMPEAAALIGEQLPLNIANMNQVIEQLRALTPNAILLKGGHIVTNERSIDLLITQQTVEQFSSARIDTQNTHGTGCTLSSAIASYLAQGNNLQRATFLAKKYISLAIEHADELSIGHGHGPVNHFFTGHQHLTT